MGFTKVLGSNNSLTVSNVAPGGLVVTFTSFNMKSWSSNPAMNAFFSREVLAVWAVRYSPNLTTEMARKPKNTQDKTAPDQDVSMISRGRDNMKVASRGDPTSTGSGILNHGLWEALVYYRFQGYKRTVLDT